MNRRILCSALALLVASITTAHASEPIQLIQPSQEQGGWSFGNGPEFPGAKGGLKVTDEQFRDQPVLALQGNFTGGGNYVQAAINLPKTPIDTLSFWVNAPQASNVTVRLIDGSSQCHQLRLKLNDKGGWQQIKLPVEEFFRKMGTAAALDLASQYERWGGAKDGRWHQPGKLFVVLCSRNLGTEAEILLSDVHMTPAAPTTSVTQTVPLDEMVQLGEVDWGFNLGQEFPGAQGNLELVKDEPEAGKNALRLHADFTNGGAYVGMRRSLEGLDVKAMPVIRMKLRSESTQQFALRLVDATGQCHQQKTIPVKADGEWHEVEILPAKIAGGEHWGGANDGKFHDPVTYMELMLNGRSSEGKNSDLLIADIRADVVIEATATPASFEENFDGDSLAWKTEGNVNLAASGRTDQGNALTLSRILQKLSQDTIATSLAFTVSPGTWQVAYDWSADLHSPDNSYHGSVSLEVLDGAGQMLESVPVGIGFGKQDWKTVSESVSLPPCAAQARLRVELKKTYGTFRIDNLSASRLKVQPIQQRIERILLSSQADGNLFFPEDQVRLTATIQASKPLAAQQQVLRYQVSDYWNAQQLQPGELSLQRQEPKDGKFLYTAEVDLPADQLQVGKYYELHVQVPQDSGDPVAEYTGFAILPLAETKQYAPEQIPFSIRNWDSRIPAYMRLADRLGLRMLGVWGGWKSKPPYEAHLPGLELVQKLDAKWITGTPAAQVERNGFETYSEESLRKGMRNFLEKYADQRLAMIATGNEPHGTGQTVLDNVRAYKAIYETVKAFDPKIHVIGTSVEPNEEYFRAGYYDYLDSYDFHIYEHYTKVRNTMRQYRALMEKYNAVKPIHSTELGLNSQGQTRLAVSREMIKKIVSFFAEGGDTVSWFTIQYPDPEGKARGRFGDAHCMFDCKYNLYNPRLDAITHYHLLSAICVKEFVEEKHYQGGAQAYLFRDNQGRTLQALWLDDKRQDVFVPLASEGPVRLIHIDGSQQTLTPSEGGLSLTLSEDPLLLLYDGDAGLADSLGTPLLSSGDAPAKAAPGEQVKFTLSGKSAQANSLRVLAPPLWESALTQKGEGQVELTVTVPAGSTAREARLRIQSQREGQITGEVALPVTVAGN